MRSRVATLAGVFLLLAVMSGSTTASALESTKPAELVMFDAKDCAICKRFNREVGPDYDSSASAGMFPLRRIDLHEGSVDIVLESPVTMTPTFVFIVKGAEIARFVGYPGKKYFYMLVDAAAEELRRIVAKAGLR